MCTLRPLLQKPGSALKHTRPPLVTSTKQVHAQQHSPPACSSFCTCLACPQELKDFRRQGARTIADAEALESDRKLKAKGQPQPLTLRSAAAAAAAAATAWPNPSAALGATSLPGGVGAHGCECVFLFVCACWLS